MNRHLLVSVAAVAMLGLGLQGCSKKDNAATSNAADSAVTTTTTTTTNAADATGNAVGSAADASGNAVGSVEGSHPVSDVQDAASAPVGMASAMAPKNAQEFVTAAAIGDMYEIQAAKMAEAKSTSPEIKTFAKRMIKDHTKTSAELKGLLGKGVDATPPTTLDQRRQGLLDNLKTSATGQEFDKRYVSQQIAAHDEMETLMKGYAEHGDNAALKAFAAKTAPVVQMHLDMARQIHAMPNASSKAG